MIDPFPFFEEPGELFRLRRPRVRERAVVGGHLGLTVGGDDDQRGKTTGPQIGPRGVGQGEVVVRLTDVDIDHVVAREQRRDLRVSAQLAYCLAVRADRLLSHDTPVTRPAVHHLRGRDQCVRLGLALVAGVLCPDWRRVIVGSARARSW